jgi:hypothetical protein
VHSKARNPAVTKQILPLAALLFSTFSSAQSQPVNATIDASKAGAPITKYIHGQFLEHIGGIVNNGIWAEMLDDRKFYYPITSHPPAEPAARTLMRPGLLRHWTPIGGDEFVTTVGQEPGVEVQEQGLISVRDTTLVPPFSVSIYSFAVQYSVCLTTREECSRLGRPSLGGAKCYNRECVWE